MHYYPHHIGDFVRDTARLNDSQCMAYLRLIWLYYESEKPLPNNPKILALKIGSEPELVSDLLEAFFKLDGDEWRHSRCDNEIDSFKRMSDGGRKGAEKRWGKRVDSHPIATPSPPQCEANSNQEPITNNQEPIEKHKKKRSASYDAIPDLVAEGVDRQKAIDWLAVRKAKRAAETKTAIDGVLRNIKAYGISADEGIQICCERGWAGFDGAWLKARDSPTPYQTAADKRQSFADALTGRNRERAIADNIIDIN